jgi:hypothetical protein
MPVERGAAAHIHVADEEPALFLQPVVFAGLVRTLADGADADIDGAVRRGLWFVLRNRHARTDHQSHRDERSAYSRHRRQGGKSIRMRFHDDAPD